MVLADTRSHLVSYLAKELAEYGITVNAYAPGWDYPCIFSFGKSALTLHRTSGNDDEYDPFRVVIYLLLLTGNPTTPRG